MSETELQASIKKALEGMGVWVIRTGVSVKRSNRGTSSGVPGMPDLCLPRYGWLEVKQPGHTLSPRQVAWHQKAAAHGIRVATVHSVLEAVEAVRSWRRQGFRLDAE
jgi:hypothetical protein